jgi:5'-nucleotidase
MKLPAVLCLALTAGVVAIGTPARADAAPTATYTLDSAAIWAGQRVTLTESGLTAPGAVTRTVDWGDGAVESPATTVHAYANPGAYSIKVTLNDGTESGSGVFPAGSTVTVTTSPGSYKWQRPTIYTYPGYQEQGTMLASGLPASDVWTGWGDGETSLLGSGTSATVTHWYAAGTWTPKITLENEQGPATPRAANTLTVRDDDTTAPSVSLTVPSTPTKASSWKTVKGKASDSQAGMDVVGFQAYKWNATTTYYYNFSSKKWAKYTGQNVPEAQALRPVDAAGNWSASLSGLAKGWTLQVWYYAWDKVGNGSADYHKTYTLKS